MTSPSIKKDHLIDLERSLTQRDNSRIIIPKKECAKNTLSHFHRMSNEKNLHINGSSHILLLNYFFVNILLKIYTHKCARKTAELT